MIVNNELLASLTKLQDEIGECNVRAKGDAVGNIVIFLAAYCNQNKLSLAKCVARAWNEENGRSE